MTPCVNVNFTIFFAYINILVIYRLKKGNKYGDGFSGLINSFLIAGADSVLATHWPVEDDASRILITQTFDKIIKRKLSTSEALKQTKIEFIEGIYGNKYKNPLFWAPYVIIGK